MPLLHLDVVLPEDTWTYVLTGPCGASGPVAGLAVVIPDSTPDGELSTSSDATLACVAVANGPLLTTIRQPV
jgi:hypothetical protein